MRVYLLTEEQLGQPYEGATQQDAIQAAVAAQGLAGTVYIVPQARVRKLTVSIAAVMPTVTIVSDDPIPNASTDPIT